MKNHFRLALCAVICVASSAACFAIEPIDDQATSQFAVNFYRLRPLVRNGAAARAAARARADERKKSEKREAKNIKEATEAAVEAQAKKDARNAQLDQTAKQQAGRIQTNLAKGGLTKDDLDALVTREQTLTDLQKNLTKGDSAPKREEITQLITAVGAASQTLWQARQIPNGTQPLYRLGSTVFLKSDFATRLIASDIPGNDAQQIARDFQKLLADEKELVAGDLPAETREKTQSRYNQVLGKYFELHAPSTNAGD